MPAEMSRHPSETVAILLFLIISSETKCSREISIATSTEISPLGAASVEMTGSFAEVPQVPLRTSGTRAVLGISVLRLRGVLSCTPTNRVHDTVLNIHLPEHEENVRDDRRRDGNRRGSRAHGHADRRSDPKPCCGREPFDVFSLS